MLSCLFQVHAGVLLKLFNLILNSKNVLPECVVSLIVPIHKGGTKSDPLNYRRISVLSCLGKFFLLILNNRLVEFVLDNGILIQCLGTNYLKKLHGAGVKGNVFNIIRTIVHL